MLDEFWGISDKVVADEEGGRIRMFKKLFPQVGYAKGRQLSLIIRPTEQHIGLTPFLDERLDVHGVGTNAAVDMAANSEISVVKFRLCRMPCFVDLLSI